jgi:hypothetical protein
MEMDDTIYEFDDKTPGPHELDDAEAFERARVAEDISLGEGVEELGEVAEWPGGDDFPLYEGEQLDDEVEE